MPRPGEARLGTQVGEILIALGNGRPLSSRSAAGATQCDCFGRLLLERSSSGLLEWGQRKRDEVSDAILTRERRSAEDFHQCAREQGT